MNESKNSDGWTSLYDLVTNPETRVYLQKKYAFEADFKDADTYLKKLLTIRKFYRENEEEIVQLGRPMGLNSILAETLKTHLLIQSFL